MINVPLLYIAICTSESINVDWKVNGGPMKSTNGACFNGLQKKQKAIEIIKQCTHGLAVPTTVDQLEHIWKV